MGEGIWGSKNALPIVILWSIVCRIDTIKNKGSTPLYDPYYHIFVWGHSTNFSLNCANLMSTFTRFYSYIFIPPPHLILLFCLPFPWLVQLTRFLVKLILYRHIYVMQWGHHHVSWRDNLHVYCIVYLYYLCVLRIKIRTHCVAPSTGAANGLSWT